MIFVTGTKRSGTSMWMKILIEAGFPYIGKPYPKNWIHSIKEANEEGFYESPLRRGVYHATNPNPKTGAYLFPQKTKIHAIKVFIPGLVRSDLAFIHRVVGTIRPWREYTTSLRRLYAMEDEFLKTQPKKEQALLSPHEMAVLQRGSLHPAWEWWRENYDLIRNFATRRFAFNLVSYQKLLSNPDEIIAPVIEWCAKDSIPIERLDLDKAIAVVKPKLNTQKETTITDSPLTPEQEVLFDELHDYFYRQAPLQSSFIEKLNELDLVLSPQIRSHRKQDAMLFQNSLRNMGLSEKEALDMSERNIEESRQI